MNETKPYLVVQLHPDYADEVSARRAVAEAEGKDYLITTEEAQSIVAKIGEREVPEDIKIQHEFYKLLDSLNEEEAQRVIEHFAKIGEAS